MTLSEILGFLSLAGLVAFLGQAIWTSAGRSQDKIDHANHGVDSIPNAINTALMVSPDQGVITIADLNSEHRVLFRAYNFPNGGSGLEFGFPIAGWSQAHSASLREKLRSQGISFRENREPYGDFVADVHVDCGRDIDKAVALVRLCFFDLYRLPSNSRFQTSPSKWPGQEDIVGPNVVGHREYTRIMGLTPLNLMIRTAVYHLGLPIFGYPALWFAWFLADPRQPDWQWSFGSFQVSGSHPTWIFLLIFIALCVGFTGVNKEMARYATPPPEPLGEYLFSRFTALLVAAALPLAVVTSWIGF